MSNIEIHTTPVFGKLWTALNDDKVRGIVLEGGSRSSKTWSIAQALTIYGLQHPNQTILATRQKYTWVRMSILATMQKVIESTGLDVRFTRNPFRYEWNNNELTFGGLDTPQKIHGVETDIFWINEAIEATKDDFDQLEQRCKNKWILDYNPSTDEHWIYDNVLKRDDVVYIHSTVFDNPFAPDAVIKKIKSYEPTDTNIANGTADEYKWEVYGLGKRSRREGVVFSNWAECDNMPDSYQWECYGIDFGFTNDPTAIIRVVFADGELWCEELCYETEMTNQDISKRLVKLGVTQSKEIVADSAEPKSIREIKLEGFNIRGSVKGQDSIRQTIDIVKRYKVNVLSSSENFIKEIKNYVWQKDFSTNKYKDKPIDDFNHCFAGDTKITTINGDINIKDIKEGDLVLTRNGWKPVLHRFNNGIEKTIELRLHFDTFLVSLQCTEEHKFKTKRGWIEAINLKDTDTIYLRKSLMEKHTTCIEVKNISVRDAIDFIELCGNTIMEKFPKVITFIMLTATLIIIPLATLILLVENYIIGLLVNSDTKTILNGSKNFTKKVLKQLKIGINPKRVMSGINKLLKINGRKRNDTQKNVKFAEKNTKHHSRQGQNTAIITAKLKRLEIEEKDYCNVYDLMVDGKHEYLANGILVHNCIDPLRYVVEHKLGKRQSGVYIIK